MKDETRNYLSSRRVRDQAAIVLLIGVVLLVSPIAGIFNIDVKVGGIPFALLYLFLVWAGLIFLARLLANRLVRSDAGEDRAEVDTKRVPRDPPE